MSKALKTYLFYFLILVYVSGTIGFVLNPAFFRPFTPFTLMLTAYVFLIHQPWKTSEYGLSFITLILIGFTVEIIGVNTGLIFGEYIYGQSMGFAVLGVPLVISLNWALLIALGILISKYLSNNRWAASLISALIITGTDFLMEQVCADLDFWQFESGIAGIHNYIAWFLISLISSYVFFKPLSRGNKLMALKILALQILFFGLNFLIKLF